MSPQSQSSAGVTWKWIVGVLLVIIGTLAGQALRRVDQQGDTIGINGNRITRLEERYEASQRQQDRIEGKLDRLETLLENHR